MSEGRRPPWSAEAERAVLAGILIDQEIAVEMFAALTESDFFDNRHKRIFIAAKAIDSRGEPIDLVMVTNELERSDELQEAGGMEYVVAITDEIPFLANAKNYSSIVKDASLLRQFISIATNGVDKAYSTNTDAGGLSVFL